ncbi:hypothetical protein MiAbB_04957 [Microcystis aeruginosa NIES-4285]|uniref:Uncharacterized protein n=1 Tax=Microcystis aeruginosa NIES-4285 TaxID=2497681 RepID=A0A402DLA9_MICAE|nr:hypothetical protein MiAbB_04957 [Microcystis aeruginosa NIES-4285]
MAQTVLELGYGGQTLAAQELGWNRTTIRKGIKELKRLFVTCYGSIGGHRSTKSLSGKRLN